MTKQTFLHGTLILVGAGFVTKVLGFIYRIALSRLIGDEGMGLFQMAFPILIFVITITTAGLPVAISKLVSEAEANRDEQRIRSILIVSILIVTCSSLFFTLLVLVTAPLIASTLLTDERAVYSLMGITPIVPIIAVSSIFRGYFQGRQQMSPYAISQIVETVTRIFTVILMARFLLPFGVEFAAAGAMIGMVIGEFAGMLFLLRSYKKDPHRPPIRFRPGEALKLKQWGRFRDTTVRLMRLAVPVTASRMVGSLSYAVEPIVVSQSLALAGISVAASTAMYGRLEGMAIPLLFFPAFITYALSVSLVPAISEAAAKGQQRMVEHRLNQAMRLSLVVGGPCAAVMFVLAAPLTDLLYNNVSVARLLRIMAPFAVFLYLQGPLSAVLQGLDKAKDAMKNSIFGAVVKTTLIFFLGSQPFLGIDGVVIAINCGIVIVTVLHFLSVLRYIPFTLMGGDFIKLSLAVGGMGYMAHWIFLLTGGGTVFRVLLSLGASFTVYLAALVFLSLVTREDVKRIPYLGRWLSPFLPR
ncbi:stage V sporulation protein B [Melghirimyces profundicolus]|uniref:Stage V sporulation protein B n=1 Tax=Melghirimyces profundicolus TaxID=1242148 RepID=A0A2T6BH06_9BACL|nr:stage V sporulation protein B [Melghirimyces profundicolus]PTX55345.1 stage V sporulation protein B [Melghirimyces profundicolus]